MCAENLNWQFNDKENMYSYIDVLEKHGAPNFWKHFDVVLDLEMEDRDVQEALEEISREKQYQEKCLSMLVNSLELCQDDTNTSTEGKMTSWKYIMVKFVSNVIPRNALKVMLIMEVLYVQQSCPSQQTIDTRINLHILQHQSKSPVLSQGVYESVHENQLTHTGRVLNECTETDETEPVSFYRSLRARWRAIIDGLSDVVVTNAGTIRQFAMKTCVSLLPVVGDTKVMLVAIDVAIYKTQATPPMRNKGYICRKLTSHANVCLGLLGPVIHQNFYYAGLNFTSPAFPCAMSDMLHAMTFVMAVLCRYIQALSAIANDQKSYRLYGLGKAGNTFNNLPMGYRVLPQPLPATTGQPHMNAMGMSNCHVVNGVPASSNFHPMRMNSRNG
ncbi:anaphase-promoting complex subunit 2 [Tanacetum coccineum]